MIWDGLTLSWYHLKYNLKINVATSRYCSLTIGKILYSQIPECPQIQDSQESRLGSVKLDNKNLHEIPQLLIGDRKVLGVAWHVTKLYLKQDLITLRPRHNGRRFADDVSIYAFLNENYFISILQLVPNAPINNNPALIQTIHYLTNGDLVYWCIYDLYVIYLS